jgi:hypothetical protein
MTQRCLGRAGVRLLAVTGSPDEWRTSGDGNAVDKQMTNKRVAFRFRIPKLTRSEQQQHQSTALTRHMTYQQRRPPLLLLTLEMLPETTGDGHDSLDFTDLGDFNSPSGGSGIHSSARNRSEQPIGSHDYVLDMDDSDIDNRVDGECEWSREGSTQIRIGEALFEDITSHVNGEGAKPDWCTLFFFFYAYIYSTDCLEVTHLFSVSRRWSRIF